jgi:mannose/fructose/N-acetylgalactosamine-specific phosphotransferase system component IIB
VVNLLRVDARLLHGQVAVTWISNVNASSILIADDLVMGDEMAKIALKMAKPADMKLAIRSIDGAIELLNDPRSKDISIFAIVRTIEDALRLVKKTDCIQRINIGGIKKKEGSRLIAPAVYVNEGELVTLSELVDLVEEVEFRMVPSDTPRSAKSLINK